MCRACSRCCAPLCVACISAALFGNMSSYPSSMCSPLIKISIRRYLRRTRSGDAFCAATRLYQTPSILDDRSPEPATGPDAGRRTETRLRCPAATLKNRVPRNRMAASFQLRVAPRVEPSVTRALATVLARGNAPLGRVIAPFAIAGSRRGNVAGAPR